MSDSLDPAQHFVADGERLLQEVQPFLDIRPLRRQFRAALRDVGRGIMPLNSDGNPTVAIPRRAQLLRLAQRSR